MSSASIGESDEAFARRLQSLEMGTSSDRERLAYQAVPTSINSGITAILFLIGCLPG